MTNGIRPLTRAHDKYGSCTALISFLNCNMLALSRLTSKSADKERDKRYAHAVSVALASQTGAAFCVMSGSNPGTRKMP